MSALYLHIPFCKTKCNYCNFYSQASVKHIRAFIPALLHELALRKEELGSESVETIYFGGGTPSILSVGDIGSILNQVYKHYSIVTNVEITLEANPEHLTKDYLIALRQLSVNRLSVGVQSFDDKALQWLGRTHTASMSANALRLAFEYGFDNITADLIFGIPEVSVEKDIANFLLFNLPHISAYALTVEPQTALAMHIQKGRVQSLDDDSISDDFLMVMQLLQEAGYEQYELSNYAKNGLRSKHNSGYWQQKKYIGVGPSAHSYNGEYRCWNVNNMKEYIRQTLSGNLPKSCELITREMAFNEYVMLALRTMEGVLVTSLKQFDSIFVIRFQQTIQSHIYNGNVLFDGVSYVLSTQGKMLADTVISDLFVV